MSDALSPRTDDFFARCTQVQLSANIVFKGEVKIVNPTDEWVTLKSGTYENTEVDVTKQ